jgi:aspartyl-tRNA(Asn)/glutamyl-tRNA(Gln) amidotransferase subunit C
MSHFDESDLIKLMKLCKIACSSEEKERFYNSLSKVVSYMDQLNEVCTDGVSPCSHILETMHSVMREDIEKNDLTREAFLANAPSHVGGMIKVPSVMKQG